MLSTIISLHCVGSSALPSLSLNSQQSSSVSLSFASTVSLASTFSVANSFSVYKIFKIGNEIEINIVNKYC